MWFHKRYDFFGMLYEQALKSEEGLMLLCLFVQNPQKALGERVSAAENEADELRRQLIDALNRTFVTPIDREDIFALSRAIDDTIDYAQRTVEEMMLFEAQTNGHLQKMAETLHSAAQQITMGVRGLPHMPNGIQEHIIRAKKAENQMEHLYLEALAELFKTADMGTILKLREIYRHLNNAADRGDEAANILNDILVKNT